MTSKYVTIHEGEGIKMLSPKAWYELTQQRYRDELCTDCGQALFLSHHITNKKRRKMLMPICEDDYNGLCYPCFSNRQQEMIDDMETQAAL